MLLGSVVAVAIGMTGMLLAPDAAAWVWVGLLGLGLGAGFALGLVLFGDYSRSPAASARLSAMVFLVSYTVASAGPTVIETVVDASHYTETVYD